jgi:hypothetical protein
LGLLSMVSHLQAFDGMFSVRMNSPSFSFFGD